MLDRLISGAGAVTDGADRSVRAVAGSRSRFTTRPGSVLVAGGLAILAGMLVLAGLEATDPPSPVALKPADVARSHDLADRTYSTVRGSLSTAYVETYLDENGNGIDDAGESTAGWDYWLVDPRTRSGITVRSARPPDVVFTYRGTGILIHEPGFARETYELYDDEVERAGLTVEPSFVLDTSNGSLGAGAAMDLTATPPPTGTLVEVAGSRTAAYVGVCRHSPDGNVAGPDDPCAADDAEAFEIVVFDRISRHAIRVLVAQPPEFIDDAVITGQLRREERAVDAARTAGGFDFGDVGLDISSRYILDDAAAPGRAPLTFATAAALTGSAVVILIGLAGGYLIYRRSDGLLPAPATTLGPGERIPARITGILRTPTGLEHVREAPGDLIRFVLGRPVMVAGSSVESEGDVPADPGAAPAAEPAVEREPGPLATTLIVERAGRPHGVAVGRGELTRVSTGRAMTLRAPRPAARIVAATGPMVLSFDTEADRDRAIAELIDESALGPDGRQIQQP
ncbi:MAG: hypothetical protein ABI562_03155 [Chloroflexota bacterium]